MKVIPVLLALFVASAFGKVYFKETFSDPGWEKRWVYSKIKSDQGRFKWTAGRYFGDPEINKGIITNEDNKYYAMTTKLKEPVSNEKKPLVFQFEVKHENNPDCAGAYLKLMPISQDQIRFDGESKYYIMFGPDICASHRKVHLILHYNGKNLNWKKEPRGEFDQYSHVYRLVLNPNHTYEYYLDGEIQESGKLEDEWEFLKPKYISDPYDRKPSTWSDEPEIDDPKDVKPADWDDEPETISDMNAKQPEDWDEEEDGKWERPQIPNPKYRGPFRARRIPNPNYKGEWKPRQIINPDYVADDRIGIYDDIGVIAFDLWQVKAGSLFDNIIITDDIAEADALMKETWEVTHELERKAKERMDEEDRKRANRRRPRRPRDLEDEDEDEDDDDDEDDEF